MKELNLPAIAPADFRCDSFEIWGNRWLVLAAGDVERGSYNAMTVGWGFFGTMWGKPAVMAVVRPQRYTMEFLKDSGCFTLNAFAPEHRAALALLGRSSGRDVPDKIAQSGLTPVRARKVEAPAFAEAELVLECRQLYRGRFMGKEFCDKSLIAANYPDGDYHITLIAEVLRISGTDQYRNA